VEEVAVRFFSRFLKVAGTAVVFVVVLGGLAVALGAVPAPWEAHPADAMEVPRKAPLAVELVKGKPHTLYVPDDVRVALGIRKGNVERVHLVVVPAWAPPLVMPGSTRLDPARLLRLRARFAPAELVKIADVQELTEQGSVFRELRTGDKVSKDQLLGVFYSDTVGNKKNDLVDAVLQANLDYKVLKMMKAHETAVPEVMLLNAERTFQGDVNAINRAMSTLKTWVVPEQDIETLVGTRAMQAIKGLKDWDVPPKDIQLLKEKAKDTSLWGRIELKSPMDGVLIERNVALHELVQDPTVNLFQIAQVDRLDVLANVPEDDLPKLYQLRDALARKGEKLHWTVKTVGSAPIHGFIDDIGYIIDPNQHTAVVKGHIDNPGDRLRAGQFISATVDMLPPDGVVEVPMDAVVEDGQQAVVFVKSDPNKPYYTMRRVEVTNRFDRTMFVRSRDKDIKRPLSRVDKEQGLLPKTALHEGDVVILRGAGELKAALLDKESQRPDEGKTNPPR
jgi:cobalt-zinc-cadmium efflux system membrane fusion protein